MFNSQVKIYITEKKSLKLNLYYRKDNSLFEGQSPSKLDQHNIVTKLEKVLEINDFETLDDTSLLVIGFRCLLRRLLMQDFRNFQSFLL